MLFHWFTIEFWGFSDKFSDKLKWQDDPWTCLTNFAGRGSFLRAIIDRKIAGNSPVPWFLWMSLIAHRSYRSSWPPKGWLKPGPWWAPDLRLKLRVLDIHHEQNPWLGALGDELCVVIRGLIEPKAFACGSPKTGASWGKPHKDTEKWIKMVALSVLLVKHGQKPSSYVS